jgi:UDP-N-acetylglucosamine 4,6-dehydratase/5-epimerase
MDFFTDKTILVTGGTGSFGKAFVSDLLKNHNPKKVIVFSRDELKQSEMKNQLQEEFRVRYFVGDIRDKDRLMRAFTNVDYIVHAAALKQVDTGEYNPREFILTNIIGSQNVVDAAIDSGVSKVIALSTDKASSPINLYGATKLTADKLFTAANVYGINSHTLFSVVRYGNVMGSRGSIIPLFKELAAKGMEIPITDKRMTRFWITLEQAVSFVQEAFRDMNGGELFVPIIPSMRITDLANALAPNSKIKEIGIRPGEKLHEEMISADDSRRTIKQKNKFIISPISAEWSYAEPLGEKLPEGFSYKSDTNDLWLTIDDIKKLTKS